jgi:hypothetical protein
MSSQSHLEIEPKELIFRDVRLNQAYQLSLTLTNPLNASVEFSLRPSSPKYSISPPRVQLSPRQTITVTVRLFLNHYPHLSKGLQGQEDSILLRNSFFDQKVPVKYFLHSQAMRTRSSSPNDRTSATIISGSGVRQHVNNVVHGSSELLHDLTAQVKIKDHRIEELEGILGNLESKYPKLEEVISRRLEMERSSFEEKSQRVSCTCCIPIFCDCFVFIVAILFFYCFCTDCGNIASKRCSSRSVASTTSGKQQS